MLVLAEVPGVAQDFFSQKKYIFFLEKSKSQKIVKSQKREKKAKKNNLKKLRT